MPQNVPSSSVMYLLIHAIAGLQLGLSS
jgi:hypothetical protein